MTIVFEILLSLQLAALASTAVKPSETAKPQILSFQTWKSERVTESQQALDKVLAESSKTKSAKGKPDQKINQAQQNVEIAKELSVNDYFVLYLSQFPEREALVEAAKKLSPEETAELMFSFKKSLGVPGAESATALAPPPPAASPKTK